MNFNGDVYNKYNTIKQYEHSILQDDKVNNNLEICMCSEECYCLIWTAVLPSLCHLHGKEHQLDIDFILPLILIKHCTCYSQPD